MADALAMFARLPAIVNIDLSSNLNLKGAAHRHPATPCGDTSRRCLSTTVRTRRDNVSDKLRGRAQPASSPCCVCLTSACCYLAFQGKACALTRSMAGRRVVSAKPDIFARRPAVCAGGQRPGDAEPGGDRPEWQRLPALPAGAAQHRIGVLAASIMLASGHIRACPAD